MRHGWKLLAVVLVGLTLTGAAQAQTKLRYKFKDGDKLEYVVDMNQKMAMTVLGMDIDMTTAMAIEMTWQTLKVDDMGNAEAKVTIGRVKMTVEGGPIGKIEIDSKENSDPGDVVGQMFAGMVKAMASMDMSFKIDTTGEMTDIKVSEATLKKLKKLPAIGGFGNDMFGPDAFKSIVQGSIIVPLPKEEISKGKSWTQKSDQKSSIGRVVGEAKYTYDGVVEKGGKKLDKLLVKPDVKIEPSDNAQIKLKVKNGSGKGAALFDNQAGRIAEASSETTMQMEIEAGGQTIDANTTQTITLRMKGAPKSGEKANPSPGGK
jgi:hypothetical protein